MSLNVLVALTLVAAVGLADGAKVDSEMNVRQLMDLNVTARQQWVHSLSQRGCRYANQMRTSRGVHPLYFSGVLTQLGARHSAWMASTYIFRHQNLRGLGGYVGRHWLPVSAENIAMATPRSGDAAWDAHQQWVASAPHFRNMMSRAHTHCGVGISFDGRGRWWATQLFGRNYNFGNEGGSVSLAPAPAPAPAPAAAPAAAPARGPAPAAVGAPSQGRMPGEAPVAGAEMNNDVTFEAALPQPNVDAGNARDMSFG